MALSLHAGGALRSLALLRNLRKPVITIRADGNGGVGGAVKDLVFAVLLVVTELFVLSKLHVPVVVTVVFVPSRLPRDACDPLVS